ncbi:MAG TPA: NAD(P)/FAD-dependent oxidoreductase [Terriglobia bacterium]|nr:NAD(P)/FAD-dependent oxidoreductase [Terriglobia bacterium]
MPATRDIVVIGGGPNGLAAAFYLARAGLQPLVLERRPVAGGGAITGEIAPGFKCSTLAHSAGPLAPEVVGEMALDRHGLETIETHVRVFAPTRDGRALALYRDCAASAEGVAGFSKQDAGRLVEFERVLARLTAVIRPLLLETPPSIDQPTPDDLWRLLKAGRQFRRLEKKDMLRLLRWGPMAVADLAEEWFESEPLRAVVAARGVFGTFAGPRSPGTSAVLLLRAAGDPHPGGAASLARGGMGALTQAMARAATQAGAEIRTDAEAVRIEVKDGAVRGVVLASGEEIGARMVVSSADPRRTFLRLVDPVCFDPDFVLRMRNYRSAGAVAKVNLALGALPGFTSLKGLADGGEPKSMLAGRIHIGPETDYLERAFDDSKYGDFSRRPYLDVTIPSITDPGLAREGRHVMSVYVQYAPFKLKASLAASGGWGGQREALGDAVVRTLGEYAPDLPGLVLHRQVITPEDLEQTYGLTGGHIFHGELALDQLFTMRPLLGWARYRTPLRGLYLAGSGTHPGNGLTGVSGRSAAREVLADWKKTKP